MKLIWSYEVACSLLHICCFMYTEFNISLLVIAKRFGYTLMFISLSGKIECITKLQKIVRKLVKTVAVL